MITPRRGAVLALLLGALTVVGAPVAFDEVVAERTLTVNTVDDSRANVGLWACHAKAKPFQSAQRGPEGPSSAPVRIKITNRFPHPITVDRLEATTGRTDTAPLRGPIQTGESRTFTYVFKSVPTSIRIDVSSPNIAIQGLETEISMKAHCPFN